MPGAVQPDAVRTLASGDRITFYEKSHRYWLVSVTGKKTPLTSVTSILGTVLDKSGGLMHWSWALGREGKDYRQERDDAATRGTSIHDAMEALAAHGEAPELDAFPEEDRGYVRGLATWWLSTRPEVVASEVMVCDRERGFAGRFDLLARLDDALWIIDLKTSKAPKPGKPPRIDPQHRFQLAGYVHGLRVSGGGPVPDRAGILKICADGQYRFQELTADPEEFLKAVEWFRIVKGAEAEIAKADKAWAAETELAAAA